MPQHIFQPMDLAFLKVIHGAPHDDAPRLIYADWLEENGAPEHAEFIRLQCQRPYIALWNRDPNNPKMGYSYDFPWDEAGAQARLDRLIYLLPVIYHSARYECQRSMSFPEEHVRGLPLNQVTISTVDYGHSLLPVIGHFARLDVYLETDHLADFLSLPIMARADRLHIMPQIPDSDDIYFVDAYDEFWAQSIPLLADSPLIDRLEELNPHHCDNFQRSPRATENLARFAKLIEPRVRVCYDY